MDPLTFSNLERHTTYGGELAAFIAPKEWLRLRLAYLFRVVDVNTAFNLPKDPLYGAMIGFNADPMPDLEIDGSLYFRSIRSRGLDPEAESLWLNPSLLLSLRAGYSVLSWLQVVVSGTNLLDLYWEDTFRANGVDVDTDLRGTEHIGRRIMFGLEATL